MQALLERALENPETDRRAGYVKRPIDEEVARKLEEDPLIRVRLERLESQFERWPIEQQHRFNSRNWLAAYEREVQLDPEQELFNPIRVTEMPPDGDAPDEIREAWVGMVLPATYRQPRLYSLAKPRTGRIKIDHYFQTFGPQRFSFAVPADLAISTLRADGKHEAADWFTDWYEEIGKLPEEEHLLFGTDCAESITLENAETA